MFFIKYIFSQILRLLAPDSTAWEEIDRNPPPNTPFFFSSLAGNVELMDQCALPDGFAGLTVEEVEALGVEAQRNVLA